MSAAEQRDIWVPGQLLPYEAYEESHLLEDWTSLYAPDRTGRVVPLSPQILGVLTVPETTPTRLASIDLCEVLRDTHLASAFAVGKDRSHISDGIWNYGDTLGLDRTITPELVKAVMNADLVKPVAQIAEIREILLDWKQQDVYVIANTSTLPNCERATIQNLLARELSGCFDGIVLPRNYEGTSSITKGSALRAVQNTLAQHGGPQKFEKALHIDDAPHHLEHVGAVIGSIATSGALIMPRYEAGELATRLDHAVNSDVLVATSPLDAFTQAHDFLFA